VKVRDLFGIGTDDCELDSTTVCQLSVIIVEIRDRLDPVRDTYRLLLDLFLRTQNLKAIC